MTEPDAPCDTYEQFLHRALKSQWERSDRKRKLGFLAMLLASSEAWKVAAEEIKGAATARNLLAGAAGAVALRMLLKYVLGGPLGIVLTGASIASLVAVYVRHHAEIVRRVGRYRELIAEYEPKFEDVRSGFAKGELSPSNRELMIDGLLKRFNDAVDRIEREAAKPAEPAGDDDDDRDD